MPFHLSDGKFVIATFLALTVRQMRLEESEEMGILIECWRQCKLLPHARFVRKHIASLGGWILVSMAFAPTGQRGFSM